MVVDVRVLSIYVVDHAATVFPRKFSINLLLLLAFETGFQVAQASLKLHVGRRMALNFLILLPLPLEV